MKVLGGYPSWEGSHIPTFEVCSKMFEDYFSFPKVGDDMLVPWRVKLQENWREGWLVSCCSLAWSKVGWKTLAEVA